MDKIMNHKTGVMGNLTFNHSIHMN